MFAHLEILLKQSQTRLFNQIILTFFSVIYPFGVVFKSEFLPIIALLLAVLWSLKAYLDKNNSYFLIAMCFILVSFFRNFAFFYPVLVNLFMFILFFNSLKSESIITKFAKIKNPNLPKEALIYTKNLTKIWCVFFTINGFLSFILFFINKNIWAIYCGFISYVLVGILFFGEILFRKVFIKGV